MKSLREWKKLPKKCGAIQMENVQLKPICWMCKASQLCCFFLLSHDFVTQSFCHVAVMPMHAFHFTSLLCAARLVRILCSALARQRQEAEGNKKVARIRNESMSMEMSDSRVQSYRFSFTLIFFCSERKKTTTTEKEVTQTQMRKKKKATKTIA